MNCNFSSAKTIYNYLTSVQNKKKTKLKINKCKNMSLKIIKQQNVSDLAAHQHEVFIFFFRNFALEGKA